MIVRFVDGNDLPDTWRPGEPLEGVHRTNLDTVENCPFGPTCVACGNGLVWKPGLGTHIKHLN